MTVSVDRKGSWKECCSLPSDGIDRLKIGRQLYHILLSYFEDTSTIDDSKDLHKNLNTLEKGRVLGLFKISSIPGFQAYIHSI